MVHELVNSLRGVIKLGVACALLLHLVGCNSYSYSDNHCDVQVLENGRRLTLASIFIGNFAAAGNRLVERCPKNARDNVHLECIPTWGASQKKLQAIYQFPVYRAGDRYLGIASQLNWKVRPSSSPYVISTQPLILGFTEAESLVSDTKRAMAPDAPKGGFDPRTPRYVTKDSDLSANIYGVFCCPPWNTLTEYGYTSDGQLLPGMLHVVQFSKPVTVETLLKSSSVLDTIESAKSESIDVPALDRR